MRKWILSVALAAYVVFLVVFVIASLIMHWHQRTFNLVHGDL